jgi:hypothetical protein
MSSFFDSRLIGINIEKVVPFEALLKEIAPP